MSEKYVLNAKGDPAVEPELLKWAEWYEKADRNVAKDELPNGAKVSTVFLGMDHSFGGPEPILWETMIFGGPHDQYQERYATREQAVAGHAHAIVLASEEPQ